MGGLTIVALVLNLVSHEWMVSQAKQKQAMPSKNLPLNAPIIESGSVADQPNEAMRYVTGKVTRKAGVKSFALAVSTEDRTASAAIAKAVADHIRSPSAEVIPTFFTPAFVADGLLADAFNGSNIVRRLNLDRMIDGVIVARQSVSYSTNADLLNVLTADMELEVLVIPVSGSVERNGWTIAANGAGFKKPQARALAEDRLIQKIQDDTKLSLK